MNNYMSFSVNPKYFILECQWTSFSFNEEMTTPNGARQTSITQYPLPQKDHMIT